MWDMDYVESLMVNNKIKLLEPFTTAKKHHKMECLVCGCEWSATPISKKQTFKKYGVGGCPECNKTKKQKAHKRVQDHYINELAKRHITIISEYTGLRSTTHKVTFHNSKCGHTFTTYPGYLISGGTDCTVCGTIERSRKLTKTSTDNSIEWRKTAPDWKIYRNNVHSLTSVVYKANKNTINPKKLMRGKAGVTGAHHLDHIVPVRFCFDNDIPPEICADKTNLQMIHWKANVASRDHLKGIIPHIFLQYISSGDVMDRNILVLQDMFPKAEHFKYVNGICVNVYIENINTAILLLPTSEHFADQKTAIIAALAFEEIGVNYYMIFDDELSENSNLVKHKLHHYMGKATVQYNLYARRCTVVPILPKTKRDFLNEYHIQGSDRANLSLGAYLDDTLVAVMTFTKPRVGIGRKNAGTGVWELSRFATTSQYRIPGIASKLLKYFQRHNDWSTIVSYADRRWSTGKLYYTLGFALGAKNPPSYHYIINGKRKHRWGYRKDILKDKFPEYDSGLTEYQNMQNAGYWRVWDCGTLRFVLTK